MWFRGLAVPLVLCGCAIAGNDDPMSATAEEVKLSSALVDADFTRPLDKAAIRAPQTWLDDAAFEVKWTTMMTAPIELLGGADSAYFADLATLPAKRLPGHEVLCHGDPKFDNFGWIDVSGTSQFADSDFDDADYCPVAADALRYLVATDLEFSDPDLDEAALDAYVASVEHDSGVVDIDPGSAPDWAKVHTKELAKSVAGDSLILGGEVQAATAHEIEAVAALVADDWRLPPTLVDVARDVRTDGGSAGWRRFWLLTEDYDGSRTIIELKEIGIPGPTFGRQSQSLDGADRMDVLTKLWLGAIDELDDYEVDLRDRLSRQNANPDKMTSDQITNVIQAEASMLGVRHRSAWGDVKSKKLTSWLRASAATLVSRWRATYARGGGS